MVWATDVGAYLVGRLSADRSWRPAISPGKTWSGAVGGLLGAVAVGLAAAFIFGTGGSWRPRCLPRADRMRRQAGDLFESSLKRHFGVKDSGRPDPGPWRAARPAGRDCSTAAPVGGPAGAPARTRSRVLAMKPHILRARVQRAPRGHVPSVSAAPAASARRRSNCSRPIRDVHRCGRWSAGRNAALLAEQAGGLRAERAVVADPAGFRGAARTRWPAPASTRRRARGGGRGRRA